jgi:hypothetical protein
MKKLEITGYILFLFLFCLIAACYPQGSTLASDKQTVETTENIVTITPSFTIQPSPTQFQTSTPTAIPVERHNLLSEDTIEVLVFTWDWPMSADIPKLHIFNDGYAVWVEYGEDDLWHVYESTLTAEDLDKVKRVVNDSGFWEYIEYGIPIPDYSFYHFRVSQFGQEKTVVVRESNFDAPIATLVDILNGSEKKSEYFPKQGYLYTTKHNYFMNEYGFDWPGGEMGFDFAAAENGILIDGKILETIWKAVQERKAWINVDNISYYYELEIPGLSCVTTFNYEKKLWECAIFEYESTGSR